MYGKKLRLSIGILLLLCSLCFAVIFLSSTISLLSLPLTYPEVQAWKGYYTLGVEGSVSLRKLKDMLNINNTWQVISEESSSIKFFNFNSFENTSISRLRSRLDPLDPRFDPYMKGLRGYFHTQYKKKSFNLIYIKNNLHPFSFYLSASRTLKGLGADWFIAEINILRQIFISFLFGVFVFLTLLYAMHSRDFVLLPNFLNAKKQNLPKFIAHRNFPLSYDRRLRYVKSFQYTFIAGSIPWFFVLMTGSYRTFTASAFIYFGWLLLNREFLSQLKVYLNYGKHHLDFENLKKRGLFLLISLISAVLLLLFPDFSFSRLLPIFLALFATLSLALHSVALFIYRRNRQEHRLFIRVPLVSEERLNERKGILTWVPPLIFAAVFLGPFVFSAGIFFREGSIPKPVSFPDIKDFSWASLERLAIHEDRKELPNLSDYLIHRAFQEGFLYNREYTFPSREEKILLSTFNRVGDRIVSSAVEVKRFNQEWFDEVISEAYQGGITRLLMDQGVPVGTVYKPVDKVPIPRFFLLLHGLFCIVIFSPYILKHNHLTVRALYGMKGFVSGRKSQPA